MNETLISFKAQAYDAILQVEAWQKILGNLNARIAGLNAQVAEAEKSEKESPEASVVSMEDKEAIL